MQKSEGTAGKASKADKARSDLTDFVRKDLIAHGQVHSTNPMYLIDKIIRERILESVYWKEQCFGLDAATFCDRAAALNSIGGLTLNLRPSDFLCLELKLLQINPENAIIEEYLSAADFKYLQVIAAFHIRLTWSAAKIYRTLEPLLLDYRKLRFAGECRVNDRALIEANYILTFMDEFVDDLLTKKSVCGVTLPFLTAREVLEEMNELEYRVSPLEKELMQDLSDQDY